MKFLETLYDFSSKHLKTTAFHQRIIEYTPRLETLIGAVLQRYTADHQGDWDKYVQLLMYLYNAEVHWLKIFTPFSFITQNTGPTTFGN